MRRFVVLIVMLGLWVAACGEPITTRPVGSGEAGSTTTTTATTTTALGALIASDLQRQAPSAPAADIAAVAAGGRAFAAATFAQLATRDGNLAFSPASIRLALAMAYAGARGEIAAEMASALHFDLPDARLHPALNALDQALASRNRDQGPGPNGEERRVLLTVANALWGQEGYDFLPAFLDSLAQNYGAGMRVVDFIRAAETARATINDWVAEATNQRITDFIPEGALTDRTRLVITNAVYLDANWASPFHKQATWDGAFTLLDGSQVTASMMHQEESFPYAAGDGWQAVELPYVGDELAMLFLVPDSGRFAEVQDRIADGLLDDVKAALGSREVTLALPKYEFHFKAGVAEVLAAMGMPLAFDPERADFSGITAAEQLFISDVVHEAFIKVDEAGTEAAAATGVTVAAGSSTTQVVLDLQIDRPFLFSLYDRSTGEILFMGRVLNPAG